MNFTKFATNSWLLLAISFSFLPVVMLESVVYADLLTAPRGKIDIAAYRQLRQELKSFGLADSASRKALIRGQDVAFQRIDKLGDISGIIKLQDGKLSSIVAGAYGRDAAGNIVRQVNAVAETGLPLLLRHRTMTNNLARNLGANRYELGGSIIQNDRIQHLMRRFERRTTFSDFWGEEIFYYGKDYLVR